MSPKKWTLYREQQIIERRAWQQHTTGNSAHQAAQIHGNSKQTREKDEYLHF